MKKNKTVAYMLAATLLVGGTFMGTKALFTDKENAYNDLVITMGNLNVDVTEGEWTIENKGSEAENSTNNYTFTNVKPGDSFLKKVTITNNGSLDQQLQIERKGNSEDYPKEILVGQSIEDLNGKVLKAGTSIDAYINVFIKPDMGGAFGDENGYNLSNQPTFDFNELVPSFEINATQIK